jgi:putative phosphoribosyl transferase
MPSPMDPMTIDLPALRDRTAVFKSRQHAGEVLADMLEPLAEQSPVVLAIPTGGVPVGAVIAERYHWPLDVVIASKVTPPWNPEVAFGAIAEDGDVEMEDRVGEHFGLNPREIDESIVRARQRIAARSVALRGRRQRLGVARRCVILVDDGLATGFTMLAAARSVVHRLANRLIMAVPTAHADSISRLGELADIVYCPNVRHGWSFAVAQAYQHWTNLTEPQVAAMLRRFWSPSTV